MSKYQLGETESQLLQQIYAAALAPEKWHQVVMAIAHYIHANDAQLLFYDSQLPVGNFLTVHDGNSLCDRLKENLPTSKTLTDINQVAVIHTLPDSVAGLSPVWVDNTLQSNDQSAIYVPLIHYSQLVAILRFHSHLAVGQLAQETYFFLQQLAPHIARALYIYSQLSTLKKSNQVLVETLKCSNLAVLLLNANLQVLFTAPEAQKIITANPSLTIDRAGYLLVGDTAQQSLLDKLLRQSLMATGGLHYDDEHGFNLPLKIAGKLHPLKINILPLESTAISNTGQVRLAVFLNDPERLRKPPQGYLKQAYCFTRTEIQVANLLVNGCDVSEIARQRRTTLETTRWQIKSLMHKTHTSSQPELVRLLMLLSREFSNTLAIPNTVPDTFPPHLGDA